MEVSMIRQAYILLYSLIIGAALGAVYDTIRIQRVLLGVQYAHKTVAVLGRIRLPLIGKRSASGSKLLSFIKFCLRFMRDIIVFVQDLLFLLFAAAVMAVFIYHANDGQIRWFAFFGAVIGFWLYYNTVGRLVMLCSEFIAFIIKTLISYLVFFISAPIIFVCRRLIALSAFLYRIFRRRLGIIVFSFRLRRYFAVRRRDLLAESKNGFLKYT